MLSRTIYCRILRPAAVNRIIYHDGGTSDPYALVPQHYNAELDRWEYTAYDIDEGAQTVTFYLDHFSDSILADYGSRSDQASAEKGGMLNMLTVQLLPSKLEQAFTAYAGAQKYVDALLARDEQLPLCGLSHDLRSRQRRFERHDHRRGVKDQLHVGVFLY